MIHLIAVLTLTCTSPGIIDGDTLQCGSERVRLFGLDAPERYQPTGPAATRQLANLTKGSTLICVEAGKRSYGRLVARCTANGHDLTCQMIQSGTAREWEAYSHGEYRECRP